MKKFLKIFPKILTASLVVLMLTLTLQIFNPSKTSALSGSDFNASNIIDDAVFFNKDSMSVSEIQNFLNAKVPTCDTNGSQSYTYRYNANPLRLNFAGDSNTPADPYVTTSRAVYGDRMYSLKPEKGSRAPYTCLKNYSVSIPGRTADAYCSGAVSAGTKSSAQIIYDVAQACGVSPKVLIVLLQKEQSLVTDDWPWGINYDKATGYYCPDDPNRPGWCNPEYAGLFNQVWYAARQFKRYVALPDSYNFASGRTSFISYQANRPDCGGTNLTLQNGATAALYNYTPYQPNAAALSNLYGLGNDCSAYGNRNFWRMFNDWFGSVRVGTPFSWSYESQSAYSNSNRTQTYTSDLTAAPGEKTYLRLRARNTGSQQWLQNVVLGTSKPYDRASPFQDSSWLSSRRPGRLLESSVAPGQIGTFEFELTAPPTTGTYREYFNILIEGVTWFNDPGFHFTINVVSPTSPAAVDNTMTSGDILKPGEYIISPDRNSTFMLQQDGNVVLYQNFKPVWNSGTAGETVDRLVMQGDGNLVLYGTSDSSDPVWFSGTNQASNGSLNLQSDGNLVLYNSSNVAQWQTNTVHKPNLLSYVNISITNSKLYPGQQLQTADRRYRLILQSDGNLVLYSPNRATWSTGTWGKNVAYLAMQGDGNLVIYDKAGRPVWYTGTPGNNGAQLIIQQDGNLVLYNSAGSAKWNSGTPNVQ